MQLTKIICTDQKMNSDYCPILITAGGRLVCARCTAKSKRTGGQCGRPALRVSKTQKCQFHGGRGSGPKTPEGRQRVAQAHTVHGRETRQIRQERSQTALRLAQLEDMMHVLGMTTATRSRGRKPSSYWPVKTVADAPRVMVEDAIWDTSLRSLG